MNVTNSIGEETTVHWHGLHVAPENDGGPHTIIDPNTTWSPKFTVLDKAATYWYHPHAHGSTAKHMVEGLAGFDHSKGCGGSSIFPAPYLWCR